MSYNGWLLRIFNNEFTIQFGTVASNGTDTVKILPISYMQKQCACVANVFNKQANADHTIIWQLRKESFVASNIDSDGRYFYEPLVFISVGF